MIDITFYTTDSCDLELGSRESEYFRNGKLKEYWPKIKLQPILEGGVDILVVEDQLSDIVLALQAIEKCSEFVSTNLSVGICYSSALLRKAIEISSPPKLVTLDFELQHDGVGVETLMRETELAFISMFESNGMVRLTS